MLKHVKILGNEYVVMELSEYAKIWTELDERLMFVRDAIEKIDNWKATGLPDKDLLAQEWRAAQLKALDECEELILRNRP